MYNDVVQCDIHSTDTHGFSEMIFAATYFLHLEFAPRIKGIHRQAATLRPQKSSALHGSRSPAASKPLHSRGPVEGQWDEMLRLIATIRKQCLSYSALPEAASAA